MTGSDRYGKASPRFPNDVDYIKKVQDAAVPITPEYVCIQSSKMIESACGIIDRSRKERRFDPEHGEQWDTVIAYHQAAVIELMVIRDRVQKAMLDGVKG